jgi:hypothetical protein
MQVQFIKESPERYRLECARGDGSKTAASLEFRGYFKHDLMHFVVERAAGLRDSFFGMVKAGRELDELSPEAMRKAQWTPTSEIQVTEIIVAALQGASKTEPDYNEACVKIGEYLTLLSLPAPTYLTPEFCERAVAEHRSLLGRWGQLRGGQSLEFSFP